MCKLVEVVLNKNFFLLPQKRQRKIKKHFASLSLRGIFELLDCYNVHCKDAKEIFFINFMK